MILTSLESLQNQLNIKPGYEKAIKFLQQQDLDKLPDGRIDVDGDKVYALVQTKPSKPISSLIEVEAHKKYVDFHYLFAGEEIIGWGNTAGLEPAGAYVEEKDYWKTKVALEKMTLARLAAGLVMVCFPEDAHAPLLLEGNSREIRKYVMKVKI
jgi:YhcH/YjgK/YiaL family protein